MLSLCICKPFIRLGAQVGDWVIGFMPKRFGCPSVVWAGRVSEVLPIGVSPEMAVRLSKAFGGSPEVWLRMQMNFDLWHAQQNADRIKVERYMPA